LIIVSPVLPGRLVNFAATYPQGIRGTGRIFAFASDLQVVVITISLLKAALVSSTISIYRRDMEVTINLTQAVPILINQ
jgi:hypothetical protein